MKEDSQAAPAALQAKGRGVSDQDGDCGGGVPIVPLLSSLKQLPVVCRFAIIYLTSGWHIGCFQSFTIPDHATMNTLTRVSLKNF